MQKMLRVLVGFGLAALMSGCAIMGKYAISFPGVTKLGFSKTDIVQLGQLVVIDYDFFHADRKNFNPAYPTEATFPEYEELLQAYKPIANLQGRDNASVTMEFYGHVWSRQTEPGTVVISIRGTSDTQEWVDDVKFEMVSYSENPEFGGVELGFKEVFSSFTVSSPDQDEFIGLDQYLGSIEGINKIVVVGHSLGSSLAALVAFDAATSDYAGQVQLLTFASPLTGDDKFVNAFLAGIPQSLRIVNHPDLVPRVPPEIFGFRHVWHELEVNSHDHPKIKKSVVCYHSLRTYLHLLDEDISVEQECEAT